MIAPADAGAGLERLDVKVVVAKARADHLKRSLHVVAAVLVGEHQGLLGGQLEGLVVGVIVDPFGRG